MARSPAFTQATVYLDRRLAERLAGRAQSLGRTTSQHLRSLIEDDLAGSAARATSDTAYADDVERTTDAAFIRTALAELLTMIGSRSVDPDPTICSPAFNPSEPHHDQGALSARTCSNAFRRARRRRRKR